MYGTILEGFEDIFDNEYEDAMEELMDVDEAEYEDIVDDCFGDEPCDVYLDDDDIDALNNGEFESDVTDTDEDDLSIDSMLDTMSEDIDAIDAESLFEPETDVNASVDDVSPAEALEASIDAMYEQMAMEGCACKKSVALDDDDCTDEEGNSCATDEFDLDDDELDELDLDDFDIDDEDDDDDF